MLSKTDYMRIVREKRQLFLVEHFKAELEELDKILNKDAEEMQPCHCEFKVTVPRHFDVDDIESYFLEYFKGLGYDTVAEPRKEGKTIILTLS